MRIEAESQERKTILNNYPIVLEYYSVVTNTQNWQTLWHIQVQDTRSFTFQLLLVDMFAYESLINTDMLLQELFQQCNFSISWTKQIC